LFFVVHLTEYCLMFDILVPALANSSRSMLYCSASLRRCFSVLLSRASSLGCPWSFSA
jgi:hypothetical protein